MQSIETRKMHDRNSPKISNAVNTARKTNDCNSPKSQIQSILASMPAYKYLSQRSTIFAVKSIRLCSISKGVTFFRVLCYNYSMIPVSKGQKAVRACTIRLLNLGHAKYEVQNIQWMFVLHRPKRSVDSSDLRSKSADFECLQVLCASGTRLAATEAERRPCVSCCAAKQFVGI